MSGRIKASVKPALLEWARNSVRLTISQSAEKAKVKEEQIESWENGEESPSISQLRKLGKVYKRPIGVFFLSEPPKDFAPQKEFRKLAGVRNGNESPELLLAVRQASYQRQAAIDLAETLGHPLKPSLPKIHPKDDPEMVGRTIRQMLGIKWSDQIVWSSPHAALSSWKASIEELSVLIFQTGTVSMAEMRGICLPDYPFPIVILNSKDAPHGRVFSLVHEFIHILLHASGHHTTMMEGTKAPEEQVLEVAANRIAAATLLPAESLRNELYKYPEAAQGNDRQLRLLAQRVKVSPEAVLRRLVTLKQASHKMYESKRDEWQKEHGTSNWYVRQSKGGPIPQKVQILARDGKPFTRMVLDAYDRRLISTSTASDYLGAKPKHFSDLRKELSTNPAQA